MKNKNTLEETTEKVVWSDQRRRCGPVDGMVLVWNWGNCCKVAKLPLSGGFAGRDEI